MVTIATEGLSVRLGRHEAVRRVDARLSAGSGWCRRRKGGC